MQECANASATQQTLITVISLNNKTTRLDIRYKDKIIPPDVEPAAAEEISFLRTDSKG